MNKMKDFLVSRKWIFALRVFAEEWKDAMLCIGNMANRKSRKDPEKMTCDLSIRTHALEKGMSIGHVKIGFGKPKALSLLNDLQKYIDKNGSRDFVNDSCCVISKYIDYNKGLGADMDEVQNAFKAFITRNNITLNEYGGILNLNHENIRKLNEGNFALFSQSRYSVRDFSDAPLDYNLIFKAVKLCERTPSACNRQPWKIHVYTDRALKEELFKLQRGCNGFYDKMQCAILICVDLHSYGFPELNLPYVDGGIYAMNLLYALHYYDVAAIPLTLGLKNAQIKAIKKQLNLPSNEVPILLIGAGTYKEEFKVAESHRYPYTEYTFINQ